MKPKEKYRNFINAVELIYNLVLTVGVYEALQRIYCAVNGSFADFLQSVPNHAQILCAGTLCAFVLIRFFFAPSRNIWFLLSVVPDERQKNLIEYRRILLLDLPVLMTHGFVFYFICINVDKPQYMYSFFALLLMLNALWLIFIEMRVKRIANYLNIWILNNIAFGTPMLVATVYWQKNWFQGDWGSILSDWKIYFIVAMANCILDLYNTADSYLIENFGLQKM